MIDKPVVRRVDGEARGNAMYFRVLLPEPRIVYVAVDEMGDYVGITDVPLQWRVEVARLINLAVTGV